MNKKYTYNCTIFGFGKPNRNGVIYPLSVLNNIVEHSNAARIPISQTPKFSVDDISDYIGIAHDFKRVDDSLCFTIDTCISIDTNIGIVMNGIGNLSMTKEQYTQVEGDYELQTLMLTYTPAMDSTIKEVSEVETNDKHEIILDGWYRHFKGGTYKIIACATDEHTMRPVVVYQNVEDGRTWVRPKEEFLSEVDHNKYPDVKQKYRFEFIK